MAFRTLVQWVCLSAFGFAWPVGAQTTQSQVLPVNSTQIQEYQDLEEIAPALLPAGWDEPSSDEDQRGANEMSFLVILRMYGPSAALAAFIGIFSRFIRFGAKPEPKKYDSPFLRLTGPTDADALRSSYGLNEAEAFEVLGINERSDLKMATMAYRKLARIYHPDRVANLDQRLQNAAFEQMKLINRAYQTLKDSPLVPA